MIHELSPSKSRLSRVGVPHYSWSRRLLLACDCYTCLQFLVQSTCSLDCSWPGGRCAARSKRYEARDSCCSSGLFSRPRDAWLIVFQVIDSEDRSRTVAFDRPLRVS